MTNRHREVLENKRSRVKIIFKITNFKAKSRIEGYINKGRIHRELGEFFMISSNLIKSDVEMVIKIRQFDIFGKRTRRRIHGIKIQ